MDENNRLSTAREKLLQEQLDAVEKEFPDYPNWKGGLLFGILSGVIIGVLGFAFLPRSLSWSIPLLLAFLGAAATFFLTAYRPR